MTNLIEIQSQIEKLQKQADEIKAREFDKTVQDILAKMGAFGISLKDLQPGKFRKLAKRPGKPGATAAKRATGKAKGKSAGVAVAAKYRGPSGETWSGRGLMPRWLAALVSKGQARDEFLIKG